MSARTAQAGESTTFSVNGRLSRSVETATDAAREELGEMEWPRRVLPAPTVRRQDASTSPLRPEVARKTTATADILDIVQFQISTLFADEIHDRDVLYVEHSSWLAVCWRDFANVTNQTWKEKCAAAAAKWHDKEISQRRQHEEQLNVRERLAETNAAKLADMQDFWRTAQVTFKESVACLKDENAALRSVLEGRQSHRRRSREPELSQAVSKR